MSCLVGMTYNPLGRKVVEVVIPDILWGQLEKLEELLLLPISLRQQLLHLAISVRLPDYILSRRSSSR